MSRYTRTFSFDQATRAKGSEVKAEFDALQNYADDMPSPAQSWSGSINFATAGGTANALTLALTKNWTTYTGKDGHRITVQAAANNTGAATVDVDGLGATSLRDNEGQALAADDLKAGAIYDLVYDEGNGYFRVQTTVTSFLTKAKNAQSYAEEWATKAEDSLVSTAAGGDGSTDYSSLHHAAKSSASASAASTSETNAASSASAAATSADEAETAAETATTYVWKDTGSVTTDGQFGATITHDKGDLDYTPKASIIATSAKAMKAGEISFIKAANTVVVYNTGDPVDIQYELSGVAP